MKHRLCIFAAFAALILLAGCRRIVLPEEDGGEQEKSSEVVTGPIDFRGLETLNEYLEVYGTEYSPIPCEDVLPGGCVYRSVMEEGTLSLLQDCWVEGYIVGAVDGASMKKTVFGVSGVVESNIVLASSPYEKMYSRCMPVQLSNSGMAQKIVRSELNLALNPENLGMYVKVRGTMAKYFGTLGMKDVVDGLFLDQTSEEEPVVDDPEELPEEPEWDEHRTLKEYLKYYGSNERPIPCSHLLSNSFIWCKLVDDKEGSFIQDVWVEGYVVGFIDGRSMKKSVFGAEDAVKTNIIIASTPDEKDITRCVPVQLSYANVRADLNLADNPQLYKEYVCIRGNVDWYMNVLGVKQAHHYHF